MDFGPFFGPKLQKNGLFFAKILILSRFSKNTVLWYSRGNDLRLHLTLAERNFDMETSEDFFDKRNVVLRSRGNSEVISGQHVTVQGHSYDQHLNLQKS